MTARVPNFRRKAVEVTAVLGVFLVFLLVGLYSGQTTMTVEMISPPDGSRFQSSPVEFVARVKVKGVPAPDVKARFAIRFGGTGETITDTTTDSEGIARIVAPAPSGNYSWRVSAIKEGYPTIVSRSNRLSVQLSLLVYPLLPSALRVTVSPVDFKARVTDADGHLVSSANVTFYLDSRAIGSNLTATNGIARLLSAVGPGKHQWFASAAIGEAGGISEPTTFVVASSSFLDASDYDIFRSNRRPVHANDLRVIMIHQPNRS